MTTLETLLLIVACCQIVNMAIGIAQTWIVLKNKSLSESVASAGKQVALRDETLKDLNTEYRKLCVMYQELVAENEELKAKKDETD